MANKRVWNTGNPPHIGWWNASEFRDPLAWRWFDGKKWSRVAWAYSSPYIAAQAANHRVSSSWCMGPILWTDYWPPNARVPRIDPRQPSATAWNGYLWMITHMGLPVKVLDARGHPVRA